MSAYDYTMSFGFVLIDYQTQNWQTEEYQNWRLLDGLLSGTQVGAIPFVKATGLVNDFILTYTPAITAYTTGLMLSFQANLENTGTTTVNVNGLGPKTLIRDGAPVEAGMIRELDYVRMIFDGDAFIVLAPASERDLIILDGSILPVKLSDGAPVWDSSGNLEVEGGANVSGAIKTGPSGSRSLVLSHADTALTSGKLYISTADPSGGSDGDIWFKRAV